MIKDLEGIRSLGAVLIDTSFVLPRQGMGSMLGLYWFHGCKGLQPSKSIMVIEVPIGTC